jgi:hypothetical protein
LCRVARNYPAYTIESAEGLSNEQINRMLRYLIHEERDFDGGGRVTAKGGKRITVPVSGGDIGAALKMIQEMQEKGAQ